MGKYDGFLWESVRRFKARSSANVWSCYEEDLYQEAALVFLRHVRKCETEDEIRMTIPFMDILNALSRFVLIQKPVTYPKRTTRYTPKKCMTSPKTYSISYDDMEDTEFFRSEWEVSSFLEDVESNMTMKSFLRQLPEEDRKLLLLKYSGKKNREIAQELGLTDVAVHRRIARLLAEYKEYIL